MSWGFVTIKEIGEAGEEGKIFFTNDKFLHCRIKYIEIKDKQSKLRLKTQKRIFLNTKEDNS